MARKYIYEAYGSMVEYCRTLSTRKPQDGCGDESNEGEKRWTGTESYSEADMLALHGDATSAERIKTSAERIKKESRFSEERAQNRVRRAVVGSRPCVPAALSGHPMAMYKREVYRVSLPVVTCYYAVTAAWHVSVEDMAKNGAKVAEALRMVERSGIRVNLFVGTLGYAKDEYLSAFVRVKDAAKDMDVLRMAYPLVNPSFLRRHMFRLIETCPELTQRKGWADAYGWPTREAEDIEACFEDIRRRGVKVDSYLTTYQVAGMSVEEIAARIVGKG